MRCGESCRVLLSCVEASLGLSCWRLETTYTVGVAAASMPRGGMHSGSSWQAPAGWCLFRRGWVWKPPSCGHGGRSTRPWWDQASWCEASWCAERRVVSWLASQPHPCRHGSRSTREVWDFVVVMVWPGKFRPGQLCCVESSPGVERQDAVCLGEVRLSTKLVQARSRINAGGLGWSVSGSVVSRQGNVGWCWSVQGTATYRHRGRRGEASTPRGGMRLVTARPGKVRRGESRHGVVRPPSR